MQKTLKSEAVASGVGLFTGEKVRIRIKPAPAGSGILFQRIDLPGKPVIPARLQFVSDTLRCTRLKSAEASIVTVEHLLSALSASEVDNALIEVDGPEIPAGDGSAKLFIEMFRNVGIVSLDMPKQFWTIPHPVYYSEKETHLIALPSSEFRMSYTLHYPQSPLIRSQYLSLSINPETYQEEIAPCRTFSLYEEIGPLIERGLLKGGGLENGLVIQGDKVLNPSGIRFSDEMVRHKMLDLIGDLSLTGCSVKAHVIAVRSGHAANVAFARILQEELIALPHKETLKPALKGV
jgi:UDP-3-O-[3-hydroxymyristoyl] N-acetylglucosamine deacetylase